ncbi:MAG TPA: protein kinase [Thermoanaerobaculia bacterium]
MTIESGTQLGPYRVESLLGEGGMGQVYRGLDTRLDRSVAIKVLPIHLSSQPQLRERFEREARAISSLSHPHICTLFDVGQQDGTDYLVMEYLDGESLADRLTRGPLPLAEALRYGTQIAEALSEAHRYGVVHRDLKPGNVMLTKSGAKLLDFGLAKSVTPAIIGADAPTERHKPLTAEGTVLGTFQYMAPEQLEGQDADVRTDIFAFGALLYEMVTGKRAFDGKTRTSLIAAIIDRDPPPISSIQPLSPTMLERVIRVCLEKEPHARWQSAHDVAVQLRWIEEAAGAKETASLTRRRAIWPAVAAVTALLLLLLAGFMLLERSRPGAPPVTVDIMPPAGQHFGPLDGNLVISPDGRSIATFIQSEGHIVIRDLSSRELKRIQLGTEAYDLFWSPDGRSLGFFSEGKLRRVDLAGGSPRTLATVGDSRGAVWLPSGDILFTPTLNAGLSRVSSNGGAVTVLTKVDPGREQGHWRPYIFPDGKHFLYFSRGLQSEGSAAYVSSTDGMEPVLLMQLDMPPILAGRDVILFLQDRSLLGQRIDTKRWKPAGNPVVLADSVEHSTQYGSIAATASSNGVLAWQDELQIAKTTIYRLDRSGKEGTIVPDEGGSNLDLSRDDTRLAYERLDSRSRNRDIWIVDLIRGGRSRLTFDPATDLGPVWSPDGSRIAFASNRETAMGIYEKSSSGAGSETLIHKVATFAEAVDWSRDGKFIVFESEGNLHLLPLDGGGTPIPLAANPAVREHSARFSPDGRFAAYASNDTGHDEIYVQEVPPTGAKWQISVAGGTSPRWRGDGKEILYIDTRGRLQSVLVSTTPRFEASIPRELFSMADAFGPRRDYAVSHDGSSIYVSRTETSPPMPIRLVLNWKMPDF